jgi:hypothetical protein
MDTVRLFTIGCLAVGIAAGLTGAAIGSHSLISAGSVILIVAAATLIIVIAIETLTER